MTWENAQHWEENWWGDCINTFGEEQKQLVYADRMGLKFFHDGKSPCNIDLAQRSVLDIGGGPCSLLLKCVNFSRAIVVDPLEWPDWVSDRYELARVESWAMPGEFIDNYNLATENLNVDEVWIYNCLQHTQDPGLVIRNAQRIAKLIRVFEWVDTVQNVGHPHVLRAEDLDNWLQGEGKRAFINESH